MSNIEISPYHVLLGTGVSAAITVLRLLSWQFDEWFGGLSESDKSRVVAWLFIILATLMWFSNNFVAPDGTVSFFFDWNKMQQLVVDIATTLASSGGMHSQTRRLVVDKRAARNG